MMDRCDTSSGSARLGSARLGSARLGRSIVPFSHYVKPHLIKIQKTLLPDIKTRDRVNYALPLAFCVCTKGGDAMW